MATAGENVETGGPPHRLTAEEFSLIVSLAFEGLISADEAQRIIFFNRRAEEMFGYAQDEVLGKPLHMLLPEKYRELHHRHMENFGRGPITSRLMAERATNIVGLRKSGEEFPIEASICRIGTGPGTFFFTVACRDITARRRAENEVRFLSEFGEVLASTLDYEETLKSIAGLAVRFLADWCIVDLVESDGRVQRLQLTHGDASRTPLAEAWREVEQREGAIELTPVLETREPFFASTIPPGYVSAIARSGGQRRLLHELGLTSMFALPLLARGRLLGAITFLSTSKGRRFGAEDLRVAEGAVHRAALAVENARLYRDAQEALRTRDEVLGIVAHDLRNPLNSISLAGTMLLRQLPQQDATARKLVDTMLHACERASRLIRDLLEATRLETGHLFLERRRQPAREVLLEAVELLLPAAQTASIALEVQAPANLPPVYMDRDRILQVLSNLIGNAVKFTPPGGRITVAAERKGREVQFSVADTGSGIAPENLARIFERFFQVQGADRRGAGLGLHIAKAFVEAHGGRIWGTSRPGQGTTLFFTIPLEPRKKRGGPMFGSVRRLLGSWLSRKRPSVRN